MLVFGSVIYDGLTVDSVFVYKSGEKLHYGFVEIYIYTLPETNGSPMKK